VSWRAIALNDLRVAGQRRGTLALSVGFFLGFGGLAALLVQLGFPDFEGYLDLLAPGAGLLVPLAGIVVGYETVVGERESGTAVLALSMSNSRADLVLGKLVGRTTILLATIAGPAALTGLGMAVTFPAFDAARYAGLVLVAAGYGVVFLWGATALSMSLSSSRRVIVVAFGVYIWFTLVWNVAVDVAVTVLYRFQGTPLADPEAWVTFVKFVGPSISFNYLLGELLDAGSVPPAVVGASEWFVSPTGAILALVGWTFIPVVVGYLSFVGGDL
jgi:ABC-2 type transport system permease protein